MDWSRVTADRVVPPVTLEPLRIEHAAEMAAVLAEPELYRFTGGRPPTEAELRARYARQITGRSPDGTAVWRNWVVRPGAGGPAVGFIQATITGQGAERVAAMAWTIGAPHQGRGYARAAASAAVAQLRREGVTSFTAHIHPAHAASAAVARALGMRRTDQVEGGEVLWRSRP